MPGGSSFQSPDRQPPWLHPKTPNTPPHYASTPSLQHTTSTNNTGADKSDGMISKSGMGSTLSLEEGLSPALPDGMVEDRVQVSRRKLEQMMQGPVPVSSGEPSNAETFFEMVSQKTSTFISWPTRLKIGAKTKKDPHVKIVGLPENVSFARHCVLQVLERKQNRVTLKIDVSYADHSHIIGAKGRNTQNVMRETGCHIHFPDSNRTPDLPKSNQVSVAGPLTNVERARSCIRSLAPISISIDFRDYCSDLPLAENPAVVQVAQENDVSILIRENRTTSLPFLVVKGCASQEQNIVKAVLDIQTTLLFGRPLHLCLGLEILPAQQLGVLGPDSAHIAQISERTGAEILFPRGQNSAASTFYIQGPVDSILAARRHLLGLLPVIMLFDLPARTPIPSPPFVQQLETQLGLSVSIRPKRGVNVDTQTVYIHGQERQLSQIYSLRRQLVPDSQEPEVLCPDYEFMSDFHSEAVGQNCSDLNVENLRIETTMPPPWLLSPQPSPMVSFSPYCAVYPGSFPAVSTPVTSHLPVFPAASTPSPTILVTESPIMPPPTVLHHSTPCSAPPVEPSPPEQEPKPKERPSGRKAPPPPLPIPPENNARISHGVKPLLGAPEPSPGPVTPLATKFPAVTDTPGPIITPSSQHDPDPDNAPIASGILQSAVSIQNKEQEKGQWRVVGSGRKLGEYQEMAVKASKAIQETPRGPRVPNSQFSGFFLSRSLPEAAWKTAQQQNKSTAENSASPMEDVIWEDSNEDTDGEDGPEKPTNQQKAKFDPQATAYFESLLAPKASPDKFTFEFDPAKHDLGVLLSFLNLSQYQETFRQEEIDFDCLLTMTEDDLKELGIKFAGRRKLKSAIQGLKSASANGSRCVGLSQS